MDKQKNVFLTDDIRIEQWDYETENPDRYEYTENISDFLNFVEEYSKISTDDEKKTAKSFADVFPASLEDIREWISEGHHADVYDEWRDEISQEEQYNVPMMNALRYFPDYVSFEERDRYKVESNTCLLYDNEKEAWAVGMTGGGINLTPHLVATFINLGKGVPIELADGMRLSYNTYVSPETHRENCRLLAGAYRNYSKRMSGRANELEGKEQSQANNLTLGELCESGNDTIKRNAISIKKTIEKMSDITAILSGE